MQTAYIGDRGLKTQKIDRSLDPLWEKGFRSKNLLHEKVLEEAVLAGKENVINYIWGERKGVETENIVLKDLIEQGNLVPVRLYFKDRIKFEEYLVKNNNIGTLEKYVIQDPYCAGSMCGVMAGNGKANIIDSVFNNRNFEKMSAESLGQLKTSLDLLKKAPPIQLDQKILSDKVRSAAYIKARKDREILKNKNKEAIKKSFLYDWQEYADLLENIFGSLGFNMADIKETASRTDWEFCWPLSTCYYREVKLTFLNASEIKMKFYMSTHRKYEKLDEIQVRYADGKKKTLDVKKHIIDLF